jgi:regulatory protein
MRIDLLKTTPDRVGRYWITLETGKKMALYRQTVEEFGLYSGKELSEDTWEALLEHAGKISARMRAVRIVSASNVSKRDLQDRLVRKGETPNQAREAVEWMEDLHLVDDRNTAEQVVHSCISKGYGLARAKQALFEKRIPKEYWEEALAEYPDQMEYILRFLRKSLDAEPDDRQIKKAVDALLRRGHSYGRIREGLQLISVETDDFLED